MKFLPIAAVLLVLPFGAGQAAVAVPLPRERPAELRGPAVPDASAAMPDHPEAADVPVWAGPSACALRLGAVAAFAALPALNGPGTCGAQDVVRLDAVVMGDRTRVAVEPPATLRCGMAEAVAEWVRADLAPATALFGGRLITVVNYDSFSCRGRNRIVGAKLSEHGKANALDVRALKFSNGVSVEPTSPQVAKEFREAMRASACARFKTVLGPGSDGYHEDHIHVDLAERSHGYAMCHWEVRIPEVPLPLPRPSAAIDGAAADDDMSATP